MSHCKSWSILLVGLGLLLQPSCSFAGGLAEFLATRDLLFEGKVRRIEESERRGSGGCEGASVGSGRRIYAAVREVYAGILADTLVELSCLDRDDFPELRQGARVIGWGHRAAGDSWRLWGNAIVIGPGDSLYAFAGSPLMDDDLKRGHRPRLAEVRAELHRLRSWHAHFHFKGKKALAVVRVDSVTHLPGVRTRLGLSFIRWAMGERSTVPTEADFKTPVSCVMQAQAGDTLLVPCDRNDREAVIKIHGICAGMLQVRCGYLPSFGVTLADIESVLMRNGDIISVKR